MQRKYIITAVVIIIILVGVGFYLARTELPIMKTQIQTAITGQTKSADDETAGWKTYTNKDYGFEVKYPADFFDENQQPKLLVGDCNYNVFPGKCPNINDIVVNDQVAQGGDSIVIKSNLSDPGYWDNPDGSKQIINNIPYCLYMTGDATTGHAFNYYYFATVKSNKCLVAYLATATENCDFYLPLEKGNTEQAKNYANCVTINKNQPTILNRIISTFKFN